MMISIPIDGLPAWLLWVLAAVFACVALYGLSRMLSRARGRRASWDRLGAGLLFGGLLAAVVLVGETTDDHRTGKAAPRVLGIERGWDGRPTIRFSYEAGGRTYTATDGMSRGYDPGDPLTVCYDPDNPRDAGLLLGNTVCE